MRNHVLTVGAVLVLASGTAAASALFAGSDGTAAVAEDAAVQVRSQEVLGAVTVTRALLSEGMLLASAVESGSASPSTLGTVLGDARRSIGELEARAATLTDLLGAGGSPIGAAVQSYVEQSGRLVASLEAGRLSEAEEVVLPRYLEAYDSLTGLLVAERDARERHMVAVRANVTRAADAARYVVAFLIPAMVILGTLVMVERRQRKARIRAEVERELEVRAAKDEFINAVAHELRTPLTAVVGFAETLRHDPGGLAEDERDELIGILADEAQDTASLVENLLVFARANIGDLAVKTELVSVRELVERVALCWCGRHPGRLTITGNGAVWADPIRLRQVMRNLLSNAFVHGGEKVEVRIFEGFPNMRIEVADSGTGIPADLAERAFEPYGHRRVTEGQAPSIGLGLTVAKDLARLMDGELNYFYRDGESVFELILPAAPVADEGARADTVVDLSSRLPNAARIIDVIQNRGFTVVYQPIVRIDQLESRVVGFEALSRFEKGSPPEWFAGASVAGLRMELELAAIREAVEGFHHSSPDMFLAVNTSLDTLLSPKLAEALQGIAPNRVVLELHEDTVIDNYERTRVHIDRLTDKGYRLAIDDVARGRIDLWYLVRLRPSLVKFDVSMIRDIDLDSSKQAIVNGLKWLGEVLKARVVAEGIEREEELDRVRRLGVHYGQGYLLGRPGPLPEAEPVEASLVTDAAGA